MITHTVIASAIYQTDLHFSRVVLVECSERYAALYMQGITRIIVQCTVIYVHVYIINFALYNVHCKM